MKIERALIFFDNGTMIDIGPHFTTWIDRGYPPVMARAEVFIEMLQKIAAEKRKEEKKQKSST